MDDDIADNDEALEAHKVKVELEHSAKGLEDEVELDEMGVLERVLLIASVDEIDDLE